MGYDWDMLGMAGNWLHHGHLRGGPPGQEQKCSIEGCWSQLCCMGGRIEGWWSTIQCGENHASQPGLFGFPCLVLKSNNQIGSSNNSNSKCSVKLYNNHENPKKIMWVIFQDYHVDKKHKVCCTWSLPPSSCVVFPISSPLPDHFRVSEFSPVCWVFGFQTEK